MLESKLARKMRLPYGIKKLVVFFIVLAGCVGSITCTAVEQGNACLKPCVCKWKGGKESVTCHQAGWTEVPSSGLESTIQVLDLSGNPLSQLVANEFRRLGLTHLQRVILQRCALRHIDGTAFAGLTNLIELDLSHNVLSSIPTQAFQHFPELRELKLNGNPLIRLAGHTFASASKLIRLEVANCQLNHIDHKAFHGLELLEWLRLDGNLIEVLPTATLGPLRTLRGIDLHHNPWNCTCPLRPLRSWLAARNMPFSVPPLCLFPARLRGLSWNRMPLEELACSPKIHPVDSLVQVVAGQTANLTCHVVSNPEASVLWFFADRLIVNLTTPDESPPAVNQVYYLREASDRIDRTDKTSTLMLASAREQDSGFYVCQATNRADKVSANITLLVKSNGIDLAAGQLSRGLMAGLILAIFGMLILVLLICCLCSLKRARMHASLRHRRPSMVMGVPSMNGNSGGMFDKLDQTDHFLRRQSTASDNYKNHNGSLYKGEDNAESVGSSHPHEAKVETRFPDKQWLVSNQPSKPSLDIKLPTNDAEVMTEPIVDGHRQIAMYQNKVKFNAEETTPRPILKSEKVSSPSPTRNYPDLVDLLPSADYSGSSDVTSNQDEMELIQLKRERSSPPIYPTSRYFQPTRQQESAFPGRRAVVAVTGNRRRLSDWEVNELDDDQEHCANVFYQTQHVPVSLRRDSYDSELDAGQTELIRRHHSEEFDEDFHRRYAYHTGQLNRFLFEYRALQKRLAQMQDTWGRCLDDDIDRSVRHHHRHHHHSNHQPNAQRPLRPILKNRLTLPQQTRRWSCDEQEPEDGLEPELQGSNYEVSSAVEELYYS
ncbi:uncharacterized protein LOC130696423 [Daphnia carinata]|uniref:uncharacterized protein LOC130696423 n=1 Tax=Daphnia carinata TaxID=120202 RepID=UPI00257D2A46|nr:uncharacterized protein LOC130696423 [Daphnia carinata]XP_057375483.1 uncharacterized protein LOC130696423 [Daphnia carinata]